MDLIDSFIERYRREYDFFQNLSFICAQQCEKILDGSGIRSLVTNRAKNPDRLAIKLQSRIEKKQYQTIEDIYKDIVDLSGVRIAIYFPGDRSEVDKIIHLHFLVEEKKTFPENSKPVNITEAYSKRFSGYWANHYRVKLKKESLSESQQRYSNSIVEIQVASVLMHAWSEVEHDLVYKPMSGKLMEEEYAILDELNGLVLSGEIALERLQKAVEKRVKRNEEVFNNHFELSSFLYEYVREKWNDRDFEPVMGRIDVLFNFMMKPEVSIANPSQLMTFIEFLDSDTENRPIAQQIIDQILGAHPEYYETYESIKRKASKSDLPPVADGQQFADETEEPMHYFIKNWINFERAIRSVIRVLHPDTPEPKIIFSKIYRELELFDNDTVGILDQIRRLRNESVHGITTDTTTEDFVRAGNYLKNKINELQDHEDERIRNAVSDIDNNNK